MKYNIFNTSFFFHYKCPNSKEFIEKIDSESAIDNSKFEWGENCEVNRIPVKLDDYFALLKPSLDLLSGELGRAFGIKNAEAWVNLYDRGSFQEAHHHHPYDLICVLFLNEGEDFSEFYFKDRHNVELSFFWHDSLDVYDCIKPKICSGDIIFFPGHILHGVTAHKSDTIRKTFACNMLLKY